MRIKSMLTAITAILAITSLGLTQSPEHENGKIAFTSDRDGNLEIYAMNNDGTEQVRLTQNKGVDSFPAWSPDGKTIAFVSQKTSGAFAIKLMRADGTNQTELTPILFPNSPYPWHEKWALSWSPDGSKIAFEENYEIFTINVDGSNRINLTKSPVSDIEPSWSPDGSRIVFISSRVFYLTMHTMNATDGSDVRALPSSGDMWDMTPDWNPTGDKIAFVVHAEWDIPVLYTANADGTNRKIFDRCEANICSSHRNKPKWSPDGKEIIFHMWDFFSGDAQIYVKSVNGLESKQLTKTNGRNFQPSWQPLASGGVSVSGRVTTPEGRSLPNVTVLLTNEAGDRRRVTTSSLGLYSFENLAAGETYTVLVVSKKYRFEPRTLKVDASLTNEDFVGGI